MKEALHFRQNLQAIYAYRYDLENKISTLGPILNYAQLTKLLLVEYKYFSYTFLLPCNQQKS